MLGVRALTTPVGVGHSFEQFGRRAPRRLERVERRFGRAIGVVQLLRELVLIEADDLRIVDDQQKAEADCRGHLAVGEVMHDFAGRPLARLRMNVELLVGRAGQRFGHYSIAVFVHRDQLLAGL